MSELDDILYKYRVFRDSQAIVRECIAQEDQNILTEIKKLYNFRNWIAHGQRTKKSSNYTLEQAKEAIEKFLQAFPLIFVSNTNDPLV